MDGNAGSPARTQRDALIEQYQGYVKGTVRKLVKYMGLPASRYDEFVSAGYLGLVEAATRFNPETNDSFKHYAFLRIRGAVIDSIRQDSQIKGVAYRRAQALAAAQEFRMEEHLRSSGNSNAAKSADADLERVLNIAAKTALTHRLAFFEAENELHESVGPDPTPEQAFEKKELHQQLHTFLATLSEKERLVIENFYFKDMSFTDIANQNAGLSKSWISRLHEKGLEHLKSLLLRKRKPSTVSTSAIPAQSRARRARSARVGSAKRGMSRTNSNKPLRKRSKSGARAPRRGRISSHENASS